MIFAFGRLLLITFSVCLVGFFTVFTLRMSGLGTDHAEFVHPMLDQLPALLADGGDQDFGPAQSLPAFQAAADIPIIGGPIKSIFLGVQLRLSQDATWILFSEPRLEHLTTGQGLVSRMNQDDLKKITYKQDGSPILTWQEFLQNFPDQNLFIQILQPAHPKLRELFDALEKNHSATQIIISSPFADTTKELRKQNVRWLTGNSQAESSKSYFLTSLYLEPTFTFEGDVFVLTRPNEQLATEMMRRKRILVWEIHQPEDAFKKISLWPHSLLLTTHPRRFLQSVAAQTKNN